MRITDVNLYTMERTESETDTDDGDSEYWGGGDLLNSPFASPMSIYPEYAQAFDSWFSPGMDPFVIELETNEGYNGFAANYGGGPYACQVIDTHYRRFIEGSNPFDIERMWEQMYRAQLPYGQGGVTMMALSGVDLALWDLVGNITGQPVYNLLGGKARDELRSYITTDYANMEHMVGEGFLGIKLSVPAGPSDGREGLAAIEEMVADAREMFSDDTEIMLEAYMAWDKEFTIRVADRVKEYGVKWIEDALQPGNVIDQYRDIRHDVHPIQIAAGNLEWGHKAFHQLLDADAVDILQPEMQWAGGMTEVSRIAGIAKGHGVPIIPHCSSVYNYHFVISHTHSPYAEFIATGDRTEVKPIYDLIEGEPVPENGIITLDDDPGFGVDLNRDIIEPYGTV